MFSIFLITCSTLTLIKMVSCTILVISNLILIPGLIIKMCILYGARP